MLLYYGFTAALMCDIMALPHKLNNASYIGIRSSSKNVSPVSYLSVRTQACVAQVELCVFVGRVAVVTRLF